mmetsp:Transcript_43464/g.57523  ORF Transcript_43464/g.57523 Transcript_43464/m.57523 type:complete len:111 (-) Transcript_43464:247-579(-)
MPDSVNMAAVNLAVQRLLLGLMIAAIVMLAIAVDCFGFALHLCEKDMGRVSPTMEDKITDLECAEKTRHQLYIGLLIAFLTMVPIQLFVTMIFAAARDELLENKDEPVAF